MVAVQVGSGTARFTWQPTCGMASIQVFSTEGASGGWVLYSGRYAPENPLPSGIRYGQVPPKGLQPAAASPLSRGAQYQVVVFRWIGDPGGLGSLFGRGHATFRP